jgi:hypothetical protein
MTTRGAAEVVAGACFLGRPTAERQHALKKQQANQANGRARSADRAIMNFPAKCDGQAIGHDPIRLAASLWRAPRLAAKR